MRVVNLVRNIPRVSQAITCPTHNKYLVADFLSLMYAVMTIPQRMVMAHLKKLLTRKSLSSYAPTEKAEEELGWKYVLNPSFFLTFYKDLLFCIPNNNARLNKIPVAHGLL
ncbi:hypothetical protein NC653_001181 [Populus alba x Populus x berolinensis]|uniref:Uncharacterized protein n=2 Tax=Populus alba x Populus x berolinensis TaxID=444605 RepID=A0AAD6RKL0_9ROSI|nr:hypothetical protein NC653_001181 [Populus alba x Populus x berolinensis]